MLAGHREAPAIGRQLCVDSHQLIFSIEHRSSTALVFDLRTSTPAFVLPRTCEGRGGMIGMLNGSCSGILGVPTSSATVAFTWGSDEVVRAWDLRKPSCHAYTFSSGNLEVTNLAWHSPTSSLLAATTNPHAISYGRYTRNYQYGDMIGDEGEEDEGEDVPRNGWPRGAMNEMGFFPRAYNAADDIMHGPYRKILQYAFEDGCETMTGPGN